MPEYDPDLRAVGSERTTMRLHCVGLIIERTKIAERDPKWKRTAIWPSQWNSLSAMSTKKPMIPIEVNLAGTQKRMVSMMARVAKSSDRASFWMIILTLAIALMTAALLLFTYWSWQDAKSAKTARALTISTAPASTSILTSTPSVEPSPVASPPL